MKRIIIDMDHVMADITTHYLNWYKQRTGVEIPREELIGKNEVAAFPDKEMVRNFLYTPGFFRTAPVMEDCRKVMEQLHKYHEVFIVSAAMEFPQSLREKYDWLQEHFPFLSWRQVVLCGDKKVIKGDYMIDDHLKNLDYFDGEKLLYSSPHNMLIEGYRRVNNWKDIEAIFLTEEMIAQAKTLETVEGN
jgi:5'(3')-deoxyribonucleotidase